MTRIYVMESCPDCIQAKQQYGDNPDYEIIDIGKQARSLNTHQVRLSILTEQDVRYTLLHKSARLYKFVSTDWQDNTCATLNLQLQASERVPFYHMVYQFIQYQGI